MSPRRSRRAVLQPVNCALCSKTFNQAGLVDHMREAHSDQLNECEQCNEFFLEKEHLQSHVESEHSASIPRTSDRPQRTRKVPARIAGYDQGETTPSKGANKTSSPSKGKVKKSQGSKNANDLAEGTKKNGEDEEAEVNDNPRCPICNHRASDFQSLTAHMMVHIKAQGSTFACEQCSGVFSKKEDLSKHELTHDDGKLSESEDEMVSHEDEFESDSDYDDDDEDDEDEFEDSRKVVSVMPSSTVSQRTATGAKRSVTVAKRTVTVARRTDTVAKRNSVATGDHQSQEQRGSPPKRRKTPEKQTPSVPIKIPSIIDPPPKNKGGRPRMHEKRLKPVPKEAICIYCQEVFTSLPKLNHHRNLVHAQPPLLAITQFQKFPFRKKADVSESTSVTVQTPKKNQAYCCTVCGVGPMAYSELTDHRAETHDLPPIDLSMKVGDGGLHKTKDTVEGDTESDPEEELSVPTIRENSIRLDVVKSEVQDAGSDDENTNETEYGVEKMNESETTPDDEEEDESETADENQTGTEEDVAGQSWQEMIESTLAKEGDELTCKICAEAFEKAEDMKKHSQIVHMIVEVSVSEADLFRCGMCPKIFATSDDLRKHLKVCTRSGRTDELSNDNSAARGSKPDTAERFNCTKCDSQYANLQAFKAHQRRHLSTAYQCSVCQAEFARKTELAKHQTQHPDLRYFCEHCGLVMKTKVGLKNHTVRIHGQDTDREFLCPQCDRVFDNTQSLRNHITCVHKYKDRFECDHCERKFCYKARLRDHMRIHTGEMKYQCDDCDEKFIHGNTFRNHVRRHRGEPPIYKARSKIDRKTNGFLCGTCGKGFETRHGLYIHERSHEDHKMKCDFCPKKFKNSFYLKNHMKLHTTTPQLKCHYCTKTYRTFSALQEHIVSHTGEKPYHCEICGFDTGTINRLRKHQKSRHLAVKYTCPECYMQLTTYQGLFRHYLSHTKECPYSCSQCGKLFYLNANARRHVDFHMKKGINALVLDNLSNIYTCKECGKKLRTFANLVIHLHLTHKFTKEQFPEIPLNLLENREFLRPEEEDTPLYTACEKADRGRALVSQPKPPTRIVMEEPQIVEEVPFAQIVEQAETQEFPVTIVTTDGELDVTTTMTLPANLDRDALAMAVSQLMAMQASHDRGEVTMLPDQ